MKELTKEELLRQVEIKEYTIVKKVEKEKLHILLK